jgi:hypothetical protein|tara:strand:- start:2063 stop:2860 length:798 start_codon:yes stop_codon:yes gene_type:complete
LGLFGELMEEIKIFENIGTDKVSIGVCYKMGTTSLSDLPSEFRIQDVIFEEGSMIDHNKIYIVLIRDVMDKWRSIYKEELTSSRIWIREGMNRFIKNQCFIDGFCNDTSITKTALEVMLFLHDPKSLYGVEWMYTQYPPFWQWNQMTNLSLFEMSQYENIYFLDLADLSNPKFLEWLQEKDEKWKVVKKIPYKNKTPEHFWTQIELFWKEYNEGKILKDKYLFSPMVDARHKLIGGSFEILWEILNQAQRMVDFIRMNHERYLRF